MATKKGSTPVRSDYHSAPWQAIQAKYGQKVAFTSSSAISDVLDDNTSLLKIFATKDCWIKIGASGSTTAAVPANATRVASLTFVPGGITTYIGVDVNISNPVVAVIRDASDGTLYITEAA